MLGARTHAGGVATIVIEGEPGIGKTRLLGEIAGEYGGAGALVAWGRCFDSAGAPSMWPWSQVVREVIDTLSDPERETRLDGELGPLLDPHDEVPVGPLVPEARLARWGQVTGLT